MLALYEVLGIWILQITQLHGAEPRNSRVSIGPLDGRIMLRLARCRMSASSWPPASSSETASCTAEGKQVWYGRRRHIRRLGHCSMCMEESGRSRQWKLSGEIVGEGLTPASIELSIGCSACMLSGQVPLECYVSSMQLPVYRCLPVIFEMNEPLTSQQSFLYSSITNSSSNMKSNLSCAIVSHKGCVFKSARVCLLPQIAEATPQS